jgi:3-oxoacyl-[acyl-carrier-protein] synthase-3
VPSATLPPDLAAVAREARRTGPAPAPPRTASILGLGQHLPAEVVPNGPIAERIGVDDAWILRRTGIRSRRRAAPDERLSDLATFAARKALGDAGVEPIDVDLVLVATMSQDELTPNTAPLVAHALGAERAGAIDVGAACTGWLSGLALGAAYVETGRAERVLLIGAEVLTRLTDYDDRKTAAIFGDGAGAVVLGPDGNGAIGPIRLRADGGLADTIVATHEDRKIRMDGHDTFQNAVKRLSESTVAAVASAGLELDDIDLFVYHQANGRIIRSIGERLDLPTAKVADYIGELGNTSAASIPLTLGLLREDGRLRPGDRVLVAAIGAGFNWGAGVLEWGIA